MWEMESNLFLAYLPSSGKVPTVSIKDKGNWLDSPPTNGDYCGLLKSGIIQIDIDEKEDAELVLKIVQEKKIRCDILKTTRGLHFYFMNDKQFDTCSVGIFTAMGIQVDVGIGGKNRVVPLRVTSDRTTTRIVNGEEITETVKETVDREFIQTYDELDPIPPWLRPIDRNNRDFKNTKFRNQDLFSYILVLQTHGFTRNEVRQTLKIMNEYVLYEPLPDRELQNIVRDDAFSEEIFFGEKGKFLHDRFGDYMLSNGNVVRIGDKINIYTKSLIYSNNPDDFERMFIEKIPHLKDTQRKEVYKYMHLKCDIKGEYANPKYIGLKDFILDLENMDILPYNPKYIIQNKINFNYDENAYHELMDKTLDKVVQNDKNLRLLLEEMIGYTLYRENSMQKGFILTGTGANGKSTILNLIKHLLGSENYTALSMQELEGVFEPAELHNKLANIGDDIDSEFLNKSSTFKKAVSGETFLVQQKYGQPFVLENYSKQIFCANELPSFRDKSDGFSRRLIIIPFNAKFTPNDDDYDPFIEEKLMDDKAMEYLLKIAIEGLKRVLYNRKFTQSEKSNEEKLKYVMENNNVLQWLEDYPKVLNEPVGQVYQEYNIWAQMAGFRPLNRTNFGREMAKIGYVSEPIYADGKTQRVYIKEGED